MLRLRFPANNAVKRFLRPEYAQYQGYPFSGVLAPSYMAEEIEDTDPDWFRDEYTFPSNIYTFQGGLIPGLVCAQANGASEAFVIASGTGSSKGNVKMTAFGLLGQFVGGNLDELGGNPYIGVWLGKDSVYTLLRPAFNPEGIQARIEEAGAGAPVPLYAGPDGRLAVDGSGSPFGGTITEHQVIATIVNYQHPNILRIKLEI